MFLEILAAGKFLLDGASALAGHKAQGDAAKANVNSANAAFAEESRALALRQDQEAQANAQAVHQLSLGTDYTRGNLAANAASSNVEGNTVTALDANMLAQDFSARDVLSRNHAMTEQNIAQQRRAAQVERQSRINGTPQPSKAATAIQLGGSLAAFGYDWMKLRGPDSNTKTV